MAECESGFVCGGDDDWSYWSLSVFYGDVVCVVGSHGACGCGDDGGACCVGSCFDCFCRDWTRRRCWIVRHRVVSALLFHFVSLAPHYQDFQKVVSVLLHPLVLWGSYR